MYENSLHKLRYKVAIIGGGPAGCVCAIALAQAGLTGCVIIEASDYSQFRIGESIPPEAFRLLQTLGVDQAFLRDNHLPCYGVRSYWGDDRPGYNDTAINPYGNGWHLDRSRFDKSLAEQAAAKNTTLLCSTRFISAEPDKNGYVLYVKNSVQNNQAYQKIHADFVIDASGARSWFSRLQGSRQQKKSSLIVMAARFRQHQKKSEKSGLTHIDASAHGWWYGAQLPCKNTLLAFYSDSRTIKALGLKRTESWINLLTASPNSAHFFMPECSQDINVMAFSAPSFCLDRVYGERWLAIGDAASCWDPITSQGIVKAMASGIAAAKCIAGELSQQKFSDGVMQTHHHYVALREKFYRLEQRWPESSFWQRQQSLSTT